MIALLVPDHLKSHYTRFGHAETTIYTMLFLRSMKPACSASEAALNRWLAADYPPPASRAASHAFQRGSPSVTKFRVAAKFSPS